MAGPQDRLSKRWSAWMALGLVLLTAAALQLGSTTGAGTVRTLDQARFVEDGSPPQRVALPDVWPQRGRPQVGQGTYRIDATLESAPDGLWGLSIDRLSTERAVRINGVLLDESSVLAGHPSRARAVPVLVAVPPGVLRAGRNEIEIELRTGSQYGLLAPMIGPMNEVRPVFQRRLLLATTLPQLLNAAFAALAVFMILIWLQRRSERSIGLFGTLALLVAGRNYSYYLERGVLAPHINDWLYYSAQCVSVALLGAFAVSMSERAWPRLQRAFWVVGAGMPLMAVPLAIVGRTPELRALTYPILLALAIAALWILAQAARRLRGTAVFAVWLGLAAVVLSGAHDYLVVIGTLPHYFWIPITFPLAFGAFAIVLLNRLVHAMGQVEAMSEVLEARVAERTAALAEANAAQSRFLAAASHDLRQPVSALGLLAGLLRERTAGDAAVRSLADRLLQAVAALETQLRGLLDLSRLDSPDAAPRREPVALQDLFDAVSTHEQWRARERGLRLRLRPTSLVVDTDPVLLEQILRNLVGNALKFTQRGGVLVVARRRGAQVSLQVWDTGPGIAPEHQERIFEAFVQLGNPARMRERGMGLGLALVKRAALVLGHPLALRSAPGRGSCFSLTLPRVDSTRPVPVPLAMPVPGPRPLHAIAVLLVEDDPVLRATLTERLQAWGARVESDDGMHFDAVVARVRAADASFGVLVTDRRLPGGDGCDLVARLARLPSVVITGDSVDDTRARLDGAGVEVLGKPFEAQDLLDALQSAMRRGASAVRVG